MSKPDNPPAFPQMNWVMQFDGSDNTVKPSHPFINGGMTLRDYFAAAALQGLCANSGAVYQANSMSGWGIVNCTTESVALECYELAEAMLKARESRHDD